MHILLLERKDALWLLWVRREEMVIGINVTDGEVLCRDEINPFVEELKEFEWGRHLLQGLIGNSPKDDANWVCSIVHSVTYSDKDPSGLEYYQNDLEAMVLKQTNRTPINNIFLSALVRKYGLFPIRRVVNWIANVESHTGKSISAAVHMNDIIREQTVAVFHSKQPNDIYAIRYNGGEEHDISEAIIHNKYLHKVFKLQYTQAKRISDSVKAIPLNNLTVLSIELDGCMTNCEYFYTSTRDEEVTLVDSIVPYVLNTVAGNVISELKKVFIQLGDIL